MQDNAEKLLQQLNNEASYPDPGFSENLRQQIKQEYNKNNLIINLFTMKMSKKTVALATFAVLLLVSVPCVLFYQSWKEKTQTFTEILTKAESQKVLAGVLENNPQSVLQPQSTTKALGAAEPEELYGDTSGFLVSNVIIPKSYAYSYSKGSTETGPAINKCSMYKNIRSETTEYFDYYDVDNYFNYHYKSITKDLEGNLVSLLIDNSDESESAYIEYMGGQYAVRFTSKADTGDYDMPESELQPEFDGIDEMDEPVDEKEIINPEDYVLDFFGDDAKVEKVVENGEIMYYLVTWEYKIDCNWDIVGPVGPEPDMKAFEQIHADLSTIVIQTKIDPATHNILSEKEYFETIDDNNLLLTSHYEFENSDVDFEEVKDKFTFDYDVEIQDYEVSGTVFDLEKYYQDMRDFFVDNPMSVPVNVSDEHTIASVNTIDEMSDMQFDYLTDRDFYPEGKRGDILYEEALTVYSLPQDMLMYQVYLSYLTQSEPEIWYGIHIYEEGTSKEDILHTYSPDYSDAQIEVIVNGNSIDADHYVFYGNDDDISMEMIGDVEEGNDPDKDPETEPSHSEPGIPEETYITHLVIFEYNKKTYTVTIDTPHTYGGLSEYLNFKTYETDNPSDIDELMQKIQGGSDFTGMGFEGRV